MKSEIVERDRKVVARKKFQGQEKNLYWQKYGPGDTRKRKEGKRDRMAIVDGMISRLIRC